MNEEMAVLSERGAGPISKVVGLYQVLLRRTLEHFFPDAILESEGDRSIIDWDGLSQADHYRVRDDPEGLGILIEWFGTRYVLLPASPSPFLPAEQRLIRIIISALDLRFRGLFDMDVTHRIERFN